MIKRILLIGYGKMGRLIYDLLEQCKKYDLTILDNDINLAPPSANSSVYYSWDTLSKREKISDFDACYIVTPAKSHYEYLSLLIDAGVKNIFVEKPAVISKKEYHKIQIQLETQNVKLIVGYILRYSSVLEKARATIKQFEIEDLCLKGIDVTYKKNKDNDIRIHSDMGIFEELYHVFDMLLNGVIGCNPTSNYKVINKNLVYCKKINDRLTESHIVVHLHNGRENIPAEIFSSFRSSNKERRFTFTFSKEKIEKKLVLLFDDNGSDYAIIDSMGYKEIICKSESSCKLRAEMIASIDFFENNRFSYRQHFFHESYLLADLYEKIIQ